MKEIWKEINGFEGYYEISNLGNLKSLDRVVPHKRSGKVTLKGKVMKLCYDKDMYLVAVLYKNGLGKNVKVHRLVAESFIPNPENKLEVNHVNAKKDDNSVINLEWCSNSENIEHSTKLGLPLRGEQKSKYTEKQALLVIDLMNKGYSYLEVEKITKVKYNTVRDIYKKKRWTYLSHLIKDKN